MMSKENVMEIVPIRDTKLNVANATVKAKELYDFVIKNKKGLVINNKRHIYFTEWQTLANWYGIDVETEVVGPVDYFGDKGVKAKAKAVHMESGNVVGRAEAMCFKSEKGRGKQNWHQIGSMAQTRAGSKALKNALGWIVELGEMSSTPAEEMQNFIDKREEEEQGRTQKQDDNVIDAEYKVKEEKGGKPTGKAKKAKQEPTLTAETVEKIFKKCPKLEEAFKDVVDYENTIPKITMLRKADALLQDKEITQENFNAIKKLI